MGAEENNLTFEAAIEKLESILKKLENEETPLDQMVELYEKANKLADICRSKLKAADKKMAKLVKNEDGQYSEEWKYKQLPARAIIEKKIFLKQSIL